MTSASAYPSCSSACKRPCPSIMILFSSIAIGSLFPNSWIDFLILSICSCGCNFAFPSYSTRSAILTLSICILNHQKTSPQKGIGRLEKKSIEYRNVWQGEELKNFTISGRAESNRRNEKFLKNIRRSHKRERLKL